MAFTVDPLEAELFASAFLALLDDERNDWQDRRLARIGPVIDRLGTHAEPDAMAILFGLAALLPDPEASLARDAATRLRFRGVQPPAWAAAIGTARLISAEAVTDDFGDQDLILATFQHLGQPPHAISLTADHNFRGLFRQAIVGVDPETVRKVWAQVSGRPLQPIAPEDLAARWAAGTGMYRLYPEAPVDEVMVRVIPLLEARASALPEPPEPADEPELDPDVRRAFADAFLASPGALDLLAAGVEVERVVDWLIDFREGHGGGDLDRWSPIVVEIALVDWLPRVATMAVGEIEALPGVLRALVVFTGARRGLSDADVAEIVAAVDVLEGQYREAMADGDAFGPSKRIASAMQADGVDFDDPDAVQRWTDAFNKRSIEDRDDILGRDPNA